MQLIEDKLKRRMQNIRLSKDLRTGFKRLLSKGAETSATTEAPVLQSTSFGKHICNDHSKLSVSCTECKRDRLEMNQSKIFYVCL